MNKTDQFLHHANLEPFRKQPANATDEVGRRALLELLNTEEAKNMPLESRSVLWVAGRG